MRGSGPAGWKTQTHVERRDEPDEEGVCQQAEIARQPPAVNRCMQGEADLLGQLGYGRSEPGVAAGELEERFQQRGVSSSAAAVQEIVPDDPPYHGFLKKVRELRPVDVLPLVDTG